MIPRSIAFDGAMLYRLDRIVEITGLDLDAADVRLRLQFALHVHLALFSD